MLLGEGFPIHFNWLKLGRGRSASEARQWRGAMSDDTAANGKCPICGTPSRRALPAVLLAPLRRRRPGALAAGGYAIAGGEDEEPDAAPAAARYRRPMQMRLDEELRLRGFRPSAGKRREALALARRPL